MTAIATRVSARGLAACVLALIALCACVSAGNLRISKGEMTLELTPDGNLTSSKPIIAGSSADGEPGSLVFSRGTQKVAVEADRVRVAGVAAQGATLDETIAGELGISHPTLPPLVNWQGVIGGVNPDLNGNLYAAGAITAPSAPAKAVVYVDGAAVYEQYDETAPMQLAYVNLTSPAGGVEGRTSFDPLGTGISGNYHYIKDHLGSTRLVVNEEQQVVEATSYLAYGTMVQPDGAPVTGADEAREKFTGKEFDREGTVNGAPGIQAYHFGARMYDPEVAIWLATDPENFDWNVYAYCSLNPINRVDPLGLVPVLIPGGGTGGIDLLILDPIVISLKSSILGAVAQLATGVARWTSVNLAIHPDAPLYGPLCTFDWALGKLGQGVDAGLAMVPDPVWEAADFLDAEAVATPFPHDDIVAGTLAGVGRYATKFDDVARAVNRAEEVTKKTRKLWDINRYDRVANWGRNKLLRDPDTGLWWSRDFAGHGGSSWKVFREGKKGLYWFKDADEFGNYIVRKHKGSTGTFISWKELSISK